MFLLSQASSANLLVSDRRAMHEFVYDTDGCGEDSYSGTTEADAIQ